MQAVEQTTLDRRRTLLVLDTLQGDSAEQLYRTLGYCEPGYARSATGTLDGTVIFYQNPPICGVKHRVELIPFV